MLDNNASKRRIKEIYRIDTFQLPTQTVKQMVFYLKKYHK